MRKNFEKLLAIVIAVCMFATMLSLPAVSFADTWDGSVSDSLEGEGTEESPYLIGSAADLAYFASQVNGGKDYSEEFVKVTCDIDLNNIAFTPIGKGSIVGGNSVSISDSSACFKGTFDGGNNVIKNLNVDTGEDVSAGFFGTAYGATIKNLAVKGSVKGTKGSYALPVGGLIGCANDVTIIGCSFDGTVTSTNTNQNSVSAAGLVSSVTGGTITIDRCYVSGTIDGFGRSGGFIGVINGDITANITNSYCTADITGTYEGYTGTTPTAGGFIGFLNAGTITIDDSFYYGTAPAMRASGYAGPIINHLAGGTLTCTNTYYNSDKNALKFDGYDYGIGATEEEFADGTVLALLNGESETPVFEQGELYPVFAAVEAACEHTDVAAEWSFDEENHWHVCNTCGEPADVAAHTAKRWICGKVATKEEDGLRYKICDVCGTRFGDEVVPKIAMPVIEPGDGVPEIVVESKNAAPGKTVDVKVAIKNNPGIASMKLTVEFDKGLTLKTPVVYDIAPEETDPEMPQVIQPADAGGASPIILNWISPLANIEGDVIYATLTFEVAADAEGEQNITVTYNPNDIYNLAEENIGFAVTNGKITIGESSYIPGDINGDGEVDNKDLTRLFQYLSNWDVEVNVPALDVNGDDSVDNKDLTRLFQYLSNWDVEIF